MCENKTLLKVPPGISIFRWDARQFYSILSVMILLTTVCSQVKAYSSSHVLTIEESTEAKYSSLPLPNALIPDVHNTSLNSFRLEKLEVLNDEEFLLGHSSDPWGSTDMLLSGAIGRSSSKKRSKRSVVHLFNMVVCATGCNPLTYKGYGCYCGFLGSGYPVDGIDRCCWMHDRCYDATGCPTFSEYFVPYYWKCYRGYQPICAVTHGQWGGSGSCAQRLCECDRALAKCLRRFPCPASKAVCTSSPFRLVQNIFMIF